MNICRRKCLTSSHSCRHAMCSIPFSILPKTYLDPKTSASNRILSPALAGWKQLMADESPWTQFSKKYNFGYAHRTPFEKTLPGHLGGYGAWNTLGTQNALRS